MYSAKERFQTFPEGAMIFNPTTMNIETVWDVGISKYIYLLNKMNVMNIYILVLYYVTILYIYIYIYIYIFI